MKSQRFSRTAGMLLAALLALPLVSLPAQADPPHWDRGGGEHWDRGDRGRGSWDGPRHGAVVGDLPSRYHTIIFGGLPYYFGDGYWYRPWGSSFVVVAPPVGIVVPLLPDGYVTLNLGDSVYYRYDDVYYMRRDDGYIVVDPPAQGEVQAPAARPHDDLYVYPRQGQNERQQRNDRFECHDWAVGQTGYDPTLVGGGTGYSASRRADYLRAMSACLEGRGYTVR